MKKLCFFLALCLSLSFFQSCKQDPVVEPSNEVAPELPPQASFVMPFDGFEDADTSGLVRNSDQSRTINTFQNWFYSAVNLVVWNTALTLNLAIPVASFGESFKYQAEFQGNGSWLWSYEYPLAGATYRAELYGTIVSVGTVEWEMYISKVGGFDRVLWYEGTTTDNNATATWTLYHQANNPQPFMRVDYVKSNSTGVESIRYTNIIPNNAEKGSYIEYRADNGGAGNFEHFYDLYQIDKDNLMEIQWNKESNGRVKDPKHFQDEEWHCWDENLMDVDC